MGAKKITVVGAGHVGSTTAQYCAMEELAEEIVLVDIIEDMPMGKALDLWESAPINSFDARTVGANDYGRSAGSDIIVITSGLPRKPGMSRDDLREANVEIAGIVTEGVVKESPNAIIIMVARRHDLGLLEGFRIPEEPCYGNGGHTRFRPLPLIHRREARRLGRRCPGDGARRSRRQHGPAALHHHCRRYPASPVDGC